MRFYSLQFLMVAVTSSPVVADICNATGKGTCVKTFLRLQGTSGDEDLMPTVKQALDMMRSTRTSKKGDVVEKPTNKERRAGARLLRTTLDKLVARKKGYPNKAGTMRVATMPHFPDVPEFYDMKKVRYDTCHDLLDCDIPLDGWSVPALLLDAPASSHRGILLWLTSPLSPS